MLEDGVALEDVREEKERHGGDAREVHGALGESGEQAVDVAEVDGRVGVGDDEGLAADVGQGGWVSRVLDEALLVQQVRDGDVLRVDEAVDYVVGPAGAAAAAEVLARDGCAGVAADAVDAVCGADAAGAEVGFEGVCVADDALCFGFGDGVVAEELVVRLGQGGRVADDLG